MNIIETTEAVQKQSYRKFRSTRHSRFALWQDFLVSLPSPDIRWDIVQDALWTDAHVIDSLLITIGYQKFSESVRSIAVCDRTRHASLRRDGTVDRPVLANELASLSGGSGCLARADELQTVVATFLMPPVEWIKEARSKKKC